MKQSFQPSVFLGLWINPYFIIRRGLYLGIKNISQRFKGGKLLDLGCGSKPYEDLFHVDEYVGIDLEQSGHDHTHSKIDLLYDGKKIPFPDETFDYIFSSEVIEHVFNLDELLFEVSRVLKPSGEFGFTCPFAWNEHEQPYDYARYTQFALQHIMNKNGFEIVTHRKSTSFIVAITQLITAYIFQSVFPKNKYIRAILVPFFIAPINIFGIMLGKVMPTNDSYYHNNIVVAKKIFR